jgi:hypothetical protein
MAESAGRSKVRDGTPGARAPQADGRLPMVRGTHFNRVIFTDTLRPIRCDTYMVLVQSLGALLAGALLCGTARAATCDLGRAPTVPVVKGLAYKDARQAILSSGWKPTVGHPHNDFSNNETTFRDRGFGELQFCRQTDDSPCRFKFTSPQNVVLWITTTGDENPTLGTVASVKAAKLACADDPDPN